MFIHEHIFVRGGSSKKKKKNKLFVTVHGITVEFGAIDGPSSATGPVAIAHPLKTFHR